MVKTAELEGKQAKFYWREPDRDLFHWLQDMTRGRSQTDVIRLCMYIASGLPFPDDLNDLIKDTDARHVESSISQKPQKESASNDDVLLAIVEMQRRQLEAQERQNDIQAQQVQVLATLAERAANPTPRPEPRSPTMLPHARLSDSLPATSPPTTEPAPAESSGIDMSGPRRKVKRVAAPPTLPEQTPDFDAEACREALLASIMSYGSKSQ